jgi:predicted DNA-binding transcriptional regulator YafY
MTRLLTLLSLLQSRRQWSGAELAERLGVTDRTLRRDIDRLRALDYPVASTTGANGGYRLVSGKNLPPLQLDDEEALAVATGLLAVNHEGATRALAKLQQVMPARLRERLAALTEAVEAVPAREAPPVDPARLATLAGACRDHELVTFRYAARDGTTSVRRVEPHSLVTVRGFWYLLAFDPDRDDWRTFRVDRLDEPVPTYRPFTPRALPADDAASYVTQRMAEASYRYTVRLRVDLTEAELRQRVFAPIPAVFEEDGCIRLSADDPDLVRQYIAVIAAVSPTSAPVAAVAPTPAAVAPVAATSGK